jgi:hypothetical protein
VRFRSNTKAPENAPALFLFLRAALAPPSPLFSSGSPPNASSLKSLKSCVDLPSPSFLWGQKRSRPFPFLRQAAGQLQMQYKPDRKLVKGPVWQASFRLRLLCLNRCGRGRHPP